MRKHTKRGLAGLCLLALLTGCNQDHSPDHFGIYASDLSGHSNKLLLADPKREMTHPRPSPDRQWVTFTRYNDKGLSGTASEDGGYENTEIMIMRMDGTGVQTIIPPHSGVLAANSSWLPDGKGLIYISTDNPKHLPQIMSVDLATRKISRLPTPAGMVVADPHIVGNKMVFPVGIPNQPNSIWIMNVDGSNAHQLTHPVFKEPNSGPFVQGDYDPRISPDGSKVVFMRLFGKIGWRTYVMDLNTGVEKDLSGPTHIDGVPDWSSDGKLLIFWHVNLDNLPETGIYTMKLDGSDRRMLPLPRGYKHAHPVFFPGDGSGPNARFTYTAERNPALP